MDDPTITFICKYQAKYRVRESEARKWPYMVGVLDFKGAESTEKTIDLSDYFSHNTVKFIVQSINGHTQRYSWKTITEIIQHTEQFGLANEPFKYMIGNTKHVYSYCKSLTDDCNYIDMSSSCGLPKLFIPYIAKSMAKYKLDYVLNMSIFCDKHDAMSDLLKYSSKSDMKYFRWVATEVIKSFSGILINSNESIYNYLVRKKRFDAFKVYLDLSPHTHDNYNLMTIRRDEHGNNLLHTVCAHGTSDVLDAFISWITQYTSAKSYSLSETLDELTTARNNNDEIPIHLAAKSGNVVVLINAITLSVSNLFSKNDILHMKSKVGGSLLHYAALTSKGTDTLSYLDREEIPIDDTNLAPNGMSILELAESVGNKHAVEKYLLVRDIVYDNESDIDFYDYDDADEE